MGFFEDHELHGVDAGDFDRAAEAVDFVDFFDFFIIEFGRLVCSNAPPKKNECRFLFILALTEATNVCDETLVKKVEAVYQTGLR